MSGLQHLAGNTTPADRSSRAVASGSAAGLVTDARLLSAVAGGLAFLVMTAVLLCSRRLAGGIPADLPALVAVFAAGLSGASAVVCCRLLRGHSPGERQVPVVLLATVLCGGLSLATGAALLPAGSTFGLTALLVMAPAWSVVASLLPGLPLPGIGSVPGVTAPASTATAVPASGAAHAGGDDESQGETASAMETVPFPDPASPAGNSLEDRLQEQLADDELDEPDSDSSQVLQWTRRLRDAAGAESIVGSVRTLFPAGQRTHAVHLVFSPPLAGAPQIECETSAEAEIRCKVASAMPWGARIELRRSVRGTAGDSQADAEPVELEYFVSTVQAEAA